MKIVIVNGSNGVGKTTFEDMCLKELGIYGTSYSTIDCVKEIAKQVGWNGQKTEEARRFLSELKQLLTQYYDYPLKKLSEKITEIRNDFYYYGLDFTRFVLFVDCREPSEIQKIQNTFVGQREVITLLIRRPEMEPAFNTSDMNVENFNYDYIIDNNSDLEKLRQNAMSFCKEISN